jgi:hypothetical protein
MSADISPDAVTAAIATIAALPPVERAHALERIALSSGIGSISWQRRETDQFIIDSALKVAEAKAART